MAKADWNMMGGKDADIIAYAKRRRHVQIRIKEIRDFLKQYKCLSGFFKRGHLSRLAREWLLEISIWHFSLESFDSPFPTLSWWVEDLQTCRKHLIALWHALVEEGLLLVPSDHKRGKRLRFSAEALLDKVREWLQSGGESEQVVVESQPDPWLQPMVLQEIGPEEEEEEEPEPIAAMVRAPEWHTIREGIRAKTPKGAQHWFDQAEGFKEGDIFVVRGPAAVIQQLAYRFDELLKSLIYRQCRECMHVRYEPARSA